MNAEFFKKNVFIDAYGTNRASPGEIWKTNLCLGYHHGEVILPWWKLDKEGKIVSREASSDPEPPLLLQTYLEDLQKKVLEVRIDRQAFDRKGELVPDSVAVFVKPQESKKPEKND